MLRWGRCGLHHWFAAEQAAVCVPHCRLFSLCCLVHSTWIAYNHFSIRFACGNRVIPHPGEAHTIWQLPKQSMNGNSH